MDKEEVAAVLDEIATLLELQGENPFRAGAYSRAARAIGQLEVNLADVVRDNKLDEIPGIGATLKDKITAPDVLMPAHNAVMGLAFYEGSMFPSEYRGDLFAAVHGSWNRSVRAGYELVRVPLTNGRSSGVFEDFMTGFTTDDAQVWGRPVGVAVAHDGALLISEDGNGTIWRVTH